MIKIGAKTIIAKYLKNKFLGKAEITEEILTPILREIRIALLNSDVSLEVIRDFFKEIKEELLVHKNYSDASKPDVAVFSTIKKKLVKVLGEKSLDLSFSPHKLNKVLVVGLNGSGKTTTIAKLANHVKKNHKVLVKNVCLDVYRPGAYEQLAQLSNSAGIPCERAKDRGEFKDVIKNQISNFESANGGFIFFDNYGLLADNDRLLEEVTYIKKLINPQEVLFVMDAMSGQDILSTVKLFHDKLGITGLVISKSDSNAPMGGAFSVSYLLKIPIKYIGTGEGINDLERFYPERIASVILGEGDILTLVEKLEQKVDLNSSKRAVERLMRGQFDLNDLVLQIREMRKVGPLKGMLGMIPGLSNLGTKVNLDGADEQLKIWEIIIGSMTLKERKNPKLFKKQPNRKIRVIKGSGRKPDELNKLLKRWEEMKKKAESVAVNFKKGKNPLDLFGL